MKKIKLNIISNRKLCPNENLEKQCRNIFLAYSNQKILKNFEILYFTLRENDLSEENYLNLLQKIYPICKEFNIKLNIHEKFLLNTGNLEINGIHLKFDTFKKIFNDEKLKKFKNIIVSIHTLEEAYQAKKLGASHLILGHIFETTSKKNLEPKGLNFLNDLAAQIDIPILAIGGINEKNALSVIENKAYGVCMMSSLMQYKD